jgi:tetratricopeptide (TPR) repeat protein
MIVRDEAQVLAESVESIRAIADEVVIYDTGSSDRTPDIARRLGAVVTRGTWLDDFSSARNRAMALATGQWILWLDAGERLSADSAAALRAFVDEQASPDNAYLVFVELPPRERNNSNEQVAQVRLIPNSPLLRFQGRVRETLRPSLASAGYALEQAPGRILRHAREHDPDRRLRRAERNLHLITLEADELGEYPPRLLLALGDAYADAGNLQSARHAFLQALCRSERGSHDMLEAYYGLLASMADDHDRPLMLSTCMEALDAFPLDAQLLMVMGNYLQGEGRYDLAARSFELAVRHGQVSVETWHLAELAEVAASCWCLSLRLQGRDAAARHALEEALTMRPTSARLRNHLLELLVKQGLEEEALRVYDKMPVEADRQAAGRDAVRGACAAVRGEWAQALGYLQAAYVAGNTDAFCLRWLATTLLTNGQIEAAEPVLRHWQRIEPDNPEMLAYLAIVAPHECPPPSAQLASAQSPARRIRVDPAQVILAAPMPAPIIAQASSAD